MKPLPPSLFAGCVLISAISLGGLAQADTDAPAGMSISLACTPPDAQTANKPKSSAMDFMKKRWGKIDTNRDGIISREEYLKEAADRFDTSDLNHDGKLTPDEIKTQLDKMDAEKAKREKEHREKAKLCKTDATSKP